MLRDHRVRAFADWLGDGAIYRVFLQPSRLIWTGCPPFHTRPEFKFFADLTQTEFAAAAEIMRIEAAQFQLEADALENEVARRETNNAS